METNVIASMYLIAIQYIFVCVQASSRIKVESDLSRLTIQKIKSKMLSEDVFDSVQTRVRFIHINKTYSGCLTTAHYPKRNILFLASSM